LLWRGSLSISSSLQEGDSVDEEQVQAILVMIARLEKLL